jgi:hypothetical protein
VAVVAGVSGEPAWSQPTSDIKAGMLTCNVDSGWGFVFGSTRDLKCTYADNNGSAERYDGQISKFGVDIGYHAGGIVAWAVVAPTSDIAKGALAGTCGGVTGGAAVGVGAGGQCSAWWHAAFGRAAAAERGRHDWSQCRCRHCGDRVEDRVNPQPAT